MYDGKVIFRENNSPRFASKIYSQSEILFLPTRNDSRIWVIVFNKWLAVRKKLTYLKIEFSLFEEEVST